MLMFRTGMRALDPMNVHKNVGPKMVLDATTGKTNEAVYETYTAKAILTTSNCKMRVTLSVVYMA